MYDTRKSKCEFNLTDKALKKAFSLPHSVAFEPFVKAFQFKILNSETMQHFFYERSHLTSFWKGFELHYLSSTKQQIHLNFKDILIGLRTPELPLLNYLLLIGKIGHVEGMRNFQVYEVLNQNSN